MQRIREFFKTFLLIELLKGMALTGRNLFARKITIQYPEEKTPMSPRFRGLHALRRYPNGYWMVILRANMFRPVSAMPFSSSISRNVFRNSRMRCML